MIACSRPQHAAAKGHVVDPSTATHPRLHVSSAKHDSSENKGIAACSKSSTALCSDCHIEVRHRDSRILREAKVSWAVHNMVHPPSLVMIHSCPSNQSAS